MCNIISVWMFVRGNQKTLIDVDKTAGIILLTNKIIEYVLIILIERNFNIDIIYCPILQLHKYVILILDSIRFNNNIIILHVECLILLQ